MDHKVSKIESIKQDDRGDAILPQLIKIFVQNLYVDLQSFGLFN